MVIIWGFSEMEILAEIFSFPSFPFPVFFISPILTSPAPQPADRSFINIGTQVNVPVESVFDIYTARIHSCLLDWYIHTHIVPSYPTQKLYHLASFLVLNPNQRSLFKSAFEEGL